MRCIINIHTCITIIIILNCCPWTWNTKWIMTFITTLHKKFPVQNFKINYFNLLLILLQYVLEHLDHYMHLLYHYKPKEIFIRSSSNVSINILLNYKQAIIVHNYVHVPKIQDQHHIVQIIFQDHMLE